MVFRINLTPELKIWLISMLTRGAQSCELFILFEARHKRSNKTKKTTKVESHSIMETQRRQISYLL